MAIRKLLSIGVSAWIGLSGAFWGATAVAATITGTVVANGPPAKSAPREGGAYSGLRYKFAERIDYQHLTDFVVYIDQPLAAPKDGGDAPVATITQRDVSFEPHVMPIVVGSKVRWPNADDIFHNVFSMSEAKEFDLGLYTTERVPVITFSQVGQVDVFCSIHSKMHCIILVLPNRCFAKADRRGRYLIQNVPAGTYRLKAWQERLPGKVQMVTVPADGKVEADFTLGLSDLPKY